MTQIFCPHCAWKPRPDDLWSCEPRCGHEWHTFDTRGQCPKCRKQWAKTHCPACGKWSPHVSWYHDDPEEIARLERLLDPIEAPRPESAPA
ncbi:MAG: hypothetical protein KY445_08860 [Armatimonadetes bacterium]|nr:hypothetical protein [Armatimonadota bacterium]